MTIPSALLAHRCDDYLTARFILDAVIACLVISIASLSVINTKGLMDGTSP